MRRRKLDGAPNVVLELVASDRLPARPGHLVKSESPTIRERSQLDAGDAQPHSRTQVESAVPARSGWWVKPKGATSGRTAIRTRPLSAAVVSIWPRLPGAGASLPRVTTMVDLKSDDRFFVGVDACCHRQDGTVLDNSFKVVLGCGVPQHS